MSSALGASRDDGLSPSPVDERSRPHAPPPQDDLPDASPFAVSVQHERECASDASSPTSGREGCKLDAAAVAAAAQLLLPTADGRDGEIDVPVPSSPPTEAGAPARRSPRPSAIAAETLALARRACAQPRALRGSASDREVLDRHFRMIDSNGDGRIGKHEFVAFYTAALGDAVAALPPTLFDVLPGAHDGVVDRAGFRETFAELGAMLRGDRHVIEYP